MATTTDSDDKPEFNWLYPELLACTELKAVLKQRYIQVKDLENLEKDELVDLWYRYIIPLPQRKYRSNRRGREMTKKQVQMAKKRKAEDNDDTEPPEKRKSFWESSSTSFKTGPSSGLITKFNLNTGGDRLKPPPSCINFEKKTVKLGGSKPSKESTSPSSTISNKLSTIKLSGSKEPEALGNGEVKKKTINPISFNSETKSKTLKLKSSSDDDKTKQSGLSLSKSISLINKHLTSPDKSTSKSISLINKHLTSPDKSTHGHPKVVSPTKDIKEPVNVSSKSGVISLKNSAKKETSTENQEKMVTEEEKAVKKKIKINRISWP